MRTTLRKASRRPPFLITVLAVLLALQAIAWLIIGLTTLLAVGGFLAVALVAMGLVGLLLSWGLWTLKRWAFWITVVMSVIDLIVDMLGWIQPQPGVTVRELVPNMVLSAFILVALFMPKVHAAFR
ncbi:MAG TPA: DUF2127 domain-containing protein [Ktedonobacteraceae bacterium]